MPKPCSWAGRRVPRRKMRSRMPRGRCWNTWHHCLKNQTGGHCVRGARSEAVMEAMERQPQADGLSSLQSLLATVVIAVFVITFIVQAFQIPSESMENTLLIGDYLLVDKLCYGGGGALDRLMPYPQIQTGGIFVFPYPGCPPPPFLK